MFASDSKAVCRHLLNIYKFKIILWGKARPFFYFSSIWCTLLSIWENERIENWYVPIKRWGISLKNALNMTQNSQLWKTHLISLVYQWPSSFVWGGNIEPRLRSSVRACTERSRLRAPHPLRFCSSRMLWRRAENTSFLRWLFCICIPLSYLTWSWSEGGSWCLRGSGEWRLLQMQKER